ncbi:MAG: hypothetical protein IPM71_11915 [Bacteroidota bacterium]|nr:MAG: hypothetical protein IPM71_11915 [Bacteroidota bacterium]
MVETIIRAIEELKLKIRNNVEAITQNQNSIQAMLKHKMNEDYAGQFELISEQNRELLAQNNDLINVQLTLVNFLGKYKDTAILRQDIPLVDIYSVTDEQEVFALTIKGKLSFNEDHPFYHSPNFLEKLIHFYMQKEEYEYCQQLNQIKESIGK